MKHFLSSVLLVVDDALTTSHDDENDTERSDDIYQQIESISSVLKIYHNQSASLKKSIANRRQEQMKNELEELQKRYLEKELYLKANKPARRRLNNSNKFRYHQRLPKLSKNYRRDTRYRYNRW